MKKMYIVRILTHDNAIICGDFVEAKNEGEAIMLFIKQHPVQCGDMCRYDKFSVQYAI